MAKPTRTGDGRGRQRYMETIGFIGLGIMGAPMAENLVKAGFAVTAYNRSRPAVDRLAAAGARPAASAAEAAGCAVVITMLPDSPQVEEVVLGPGGVAEAIQPGALFIDMSTIAPATARRLAAALAVKGVDALDAPVSGGEVGAINATLSIMVGGTEAAFARALPVFKAMGQTFTRIGEAGAGQVAKACNQIVAAVTIQGVAEALVLANKAGVDVAKVREALLGGFAGSRILDIHGERYLKRNFKPGFKVKLHRKDLGIALAAGRELGLPLLATAQVAELMDALIGMGQAEADHSSLALLCERMAGLEGR
ncbi:MAG: 2-hydroxy-3-oxopropionate reductase [Thermodesulfobacteriota bacterium]